MACPSDIGGYIRGCPTASTPGGEGSRPDPAAAATSDDRGFFQVRPTASSGRVLVEAEGRFAVEGRYEREDFERGLRFSLPRPEELPRISGRVLDRERRPAAQAEIRVRPIAAEDPARCETLDGLGLRPATCPGLSGEVRTDARGGFEVFLPSPGTWEIEARIAGARVRRTLQVDGNDIRSLELRLAEECRLRGRIVDAAGIRTSLANLYVRSGRTLQGLTTRDGTFEIGGFVSGDRVQVHASAESQRSRIVPVAFGRPGETVDIDPLVLRR